MARVTVGKKSKAEVNARVGRLTKAGHYIARALIFAKAGDASKAGKALMKAAEDEEIFNEISEALADGVEDAVKQDEMLESSMEDDDIEFEEEEVFEDDSEEEESEAKTACESSIEDAEEKAEDAVEGCGIPEDTAPEVRSVEIPASVSRLARRMKNNKY